MLTSKSGDFKGKSEASPLGEGVGCSPVGELTEFPTKTRDARGIRNEHDCAKFQARHPPLIYKSLQNYTKLSILLYNY